MKSNVYTREKITTDKIDKIDNQTALLLYEAGNRNIASIHRTCEAIIGRCYSLQNWLISFITALIGSCVYQVMNDSMNVILVILSIYGIVTFGGISLYLFKNGMLNSATYDEGIEPGLPIRDEVLNYASQYPKETRLKYILGVHITTQEFMIDKNAVENKRLITVYRKAMKFFLLSIICFLALTVLLLIFL